MNKRQAEGLKELLKFELDYIQEIPTSFKAMVEEEGFTNRSQDQLNAMELGWYQGSMKTVVHAINSIMELIDAYTDEQ